MDTRKNPAHYTHKHMHQASLLSGHAHACSVKYDDLLLRQIVDVELDLWTEATGRILESRGTYIDEIVRAIAPSITTELCIHQFVPNHLISLIRDTVGLLLGG